MAAGDGEAAPAKINLSLRVRGRYADGRHRLASLMGFVELADALTYAPQGAWALACRGPEAGALPPLKDNLVWRAAALLAAHGARPLAGRIQLVKQIPVMAGLGGGSSDAAAALRLLARAWGVRAAALPPLAEQLGADVPAALLARACFVEGWGERLTPIRLPRCGVLLAVPPQRLSTRAVFDRLRTAQLGARTAAARPPKAFANVRDLCRWVSSQGNELRAVAQDLCPPVRSLLEALAGLAPAAHGMSGSGPACFALFPDAAVAQRGAAQLRRTHPDHKIWSGALRSV